MRNVRVKSLCTLMGVRKMRSTKPIESVFMAKKRKRLPHCTNKMLMTK